MQLRQRSYALLPAALLAIFALAHAELDTLGGRRAPSSADLSPVAAAERGGTRGAAWADGPRVAFRRIGTVELGGYDAAAAEITAYDPGTKRLFAIDNDGAPKVDVIDIADPTSPTVVQTLDLSAHGGEVTSVAVARDVLLKRRSRGTVVAVAVAANPKTDPGSVVFFTPSGALLTSLRVGALPDMLTFSPDGKLVLVANEGEPSADYAIDPEGSVSIVNLRRGVELTRQDNVRTVRFDAFNAGRARHRELPAGVRIFGPDASVAQDLEPEYVAVSPDSRTAWVTLQEGNALAVIDVRRRRVASIVDLGTKDHMLAGNGLDASDRDGAIAIAHWPVRGFYLPDTIAAFQRSGEIYLALANEGDARDYDAYAEEARVRDLTLDPIAFPNAAELRAQAALGRLTVTTASGDTDGDGDFDQLFSLGARSFSIRRADGSLVFDSGDALERITAATFPADFNSDSAENGSFDSRSDNKGPEPEGLTIGEIEGVPYLFVGSERIGGIFVYDVSDPTAPAFVQYLNDRDFGGDPEEGTAGDLGPEGLLFIPAADSPSGRPLLVTANEISGTVSVLEAFDPDGAGKLTLLHNNDGESSLLPLTNPVATPGGTVALPIGGIAAFESVTEREIDAARAAGHAVVNVYAGDALLASAALSCSFPPNPPETPIYDAVAQRGIAYDAHVIGNHEFDFEPDFLDRFIRSFAVNGVLTQPFLSANLDFSGEPIFDDLVDADGLIATGTSIDGRVLARSAIVTDPASGQRFGVVGATTPTLPTISSPRNVAVTPDLPATAVAVQAEIDRLEAGFGVRKILFVSHLQDVSNDRALIALLRGVDVAVAGGGELAPTLGDYPSEVADLDGRTVYLVTTAGNYKYLGRLDVEFDAAGEVAAIDVAVSYPRRVVPESDEAVALGVADAVEPDEALAEDVVEPLEECLDGLSGPLLASEVLLDTSRAGSRSRETNAGNLVTDAYIDAYDLHAATNGLAPRGPANPVVAVQNGGGIRQNGGDLLPVSGTVPGEISRLDTLNVLPFFNTLTVVRGVTPDDLKEILERAAATLPGQGGQFLQMSGLRVTIDPSRIAQVVTTAGVITTPGERVIDASLADGTPIVVAGVVQGGAPSVSIVTNSFTARGGDNYPTLRGNPDQVQLFDAAGEPLRYEAVWVDYLLTFPAAGALSLPTVPASDPRYAPGGEGRITIAVAP